MDLFLTTRAQDHATVVAVAGEIDVHTAPQVRAALADLVAAGQYHLVLDLDQVEFMDSTGLGVLLGALRRLRPHDGSLRVVCTQERILKIFRITGLTKVFPIHDSVPEALATRRPDNDGAAVGPQARVTKRAPETDAAEVLR